MKCVGPGDEGPAKVFLGVRRTIYLPRVQTKPLRLISSHLDPPESAPPSLPASRACLCNKCPGAVPRGLGGYLRGAPGSSPVSLVFVSCLFPPAPRLLRSNPAPRRLGNFRPLTGRAGRSITRFPRSASRPPSRLSAPRRHPPQAGLRFAPATTDAFAKPRVSRPLYPGG